MATYLEHVIGFDPEGNRRIYASTWIEARHKGERLHEGSPSYGAPKRMALRACVKIPLCHPPAVRGLAQKSTTRHRRYQNNP